MELGTTIDFAFDESHDLATTPVLSMALFILGASMLKIQGAVT